MREADALLQEHRGYSPAMRDFQPPSENQTEPLTLAAVDLGSNSFHMVVMRQSGAGLQVVDRVREPVRLAAGLRPDKSLEPATRARALACLERFGQILRTIPPGQLRVVGTNTLRRLGTQTPFLREAEAALGHPVEVISGVEEARLIYGGVTHGLPGGDERRLVVDIGGGSTELIIGRGGQPQLMESVHMGCVTWTQRFFADGKITARRLQKARLAAAAELEFLGVRYRRAGWDRAIGASGSVRSVWRVAAELGHGEDHLSRAGIEAVQAKLAETGRLERIAYQGLREDRQAVFVGSFVVMAGVFDALGIKALEVSDRALREGAIYDLLGRLQDEDVRDQSARQISERFAVDLEQADRVGQVAGRLFDCVAEVWGLDAERDRPYLLWASQLHEIGLAISHAGFHKHGAYVLAKADMHGFSRRDQLILAALVRVHRGRLARNLLADLPEPWPERAFSLALLLRLAAMLCRAREALPLQKLRLDCKGNLLRLRLPEDWLDEHPLTIADVEAEAARWQGLGWKLQLVLGRGGAGGRG